MDMSLDRTPVEDFRRASFLLLAEEGTERVLLGKVANMTSALLEEFLQGATGHLADAVDLLGQLLEQGTDISFIESCLISSNTLQELGFVLTLCDELLHERSERDHGLLTHPATNIASSIELVVVERAEHRIECKIEKLRGDLIDAQGVDDSHQ